MTGGADSPQAHDATTLVVGMGNPVLGDDAVGWRVVEELQRRLDGGAAASAGAQDGRIQTDCLALGGLRLMERLVGYDRAIVVDAIVTGERPAGSIAWGELPAPATAVPTHTGSAHDTTLETALRLGRALGASLPSEVLVLAIEAGPCFEFGEELSPPVAAAVPRAVDLLLRELRAGPLASRSSRSEAHPTTGASAL
jgi:hydrogenase maturation protease